MNVVPFWGAASRFYLPNEDAAAVSEALTLLGGNVRRPVFVGGSGMVLLEAATKLSRLECATFVDVARFQVEYFEKLALAIGVSSSREALYDWFCHAIYPPLRDHYRDRGQSYSLGQVLAAMTANFGINFFSEDAAFLAVKRIMAKVNAVRNDIVSYLAGQDKSHDFIYLSNVPDYISETDLKELFASCFAQQAPVYLLLTSACNDPLAVRQAWKNAGYVPHPATNLLNRMNRGLGSLTVMKKWNRPGSIWLLKPTGYELGCA